METRSKYKAWLGASLVASAVIGGSLVLASPGTTKGVRLDAITARLVKEAEGGNASAYRVLAAAIRHKPVAYSETLFEALRQRCNRRCDGLEPLLLSSFERIASAGRLSKCWPDHTSRPLKPRFRRPPPDKAPLVAIERADGFWRFYVKPVVARILVERIAELSTVARGLDDLAGLPSVARALCNLPGPADALAARKAFCGLNGAPAGDIDALCQGLDVLPAADRARVQSICDGLGAGSNAASFAPSNLSTFVEAACYLQEELELKTLMHPDTGPDAELLDKSLECMGVSSVPDAPSRRSDSALWIAGTSGSDDDLGPWHVPAPNRTGWSYNYNVFDAQTNAENAAHVGERGFVAVFAIDISETGVVEVSVVATSVEGDIGHVIVTVQVDPQEIGFDQLKKAGATIAEAINAAKRAADPGKTTEKARGSPSPTPSDSPGAWEETTDPSPSDPGDQIFAGPSSKTGACRELVALVLVGREGRALRAPPKADLRKGPDPRSEHPRGDAEREEQSAACSVDRMPRSCALADCGEGLRLDPVSCSCRSHESAADLGTMGCEAWRCRDGGAPEAVGPGCVCRDDEASAATPARPPLPMAIPPAFSRDVWPSRGWGARRIARGS